jgi:hypothetical protein
MKSATSYLPGNIGSRSFRAWVALTVIVLAIAGCGGGASTTSNSEVPVAAACDPADPSTFGECGTLLLGLTDADGEFMNYSVDVLSLTLQKANGATVQALPNNTRINFSEYVDLTELTSVANVPPGTYTSGTITLDYSNAEVYVDANGAAKAATVVDAAGNALGQTSLKIVLPASERLFISRGSTSLLTVDFDLEASHTVDIVPSPALATAEPFIVAEVDPVDTKEIRVRGHLIEVNEAESWYSVRVRPFHDRVSDFGRMRVYVNDDTECEVNEESFKGGNCLRALNVAGAGTLTVAQGTLNVGDRRFTANIILAGSSVPGDRKDAAKGTIIARDGNELVLRGGTVILTDTALSDADRAFFRDDITVTVGPDTIVYKTHISDRPLGILDRLLDISAISPGQFATIRGKVTANDALGVHIDATEGAVLLHVTRLTGIVNSIMPGQVDVDLQTIGRVRASAVDFTCTGLCEPSTDADPDNYEISTGNLFTAMSFADDVTGRPVAAWGFPNEFGKAPPDFLGRTIVDYSDIRSALGVGWGAEGTLRPFTMIETSGLTLNNRNPDIDQRHYIRQGPVLIDLTRLDSDTLIAPRETGRMLFVVKTTDSLQEYASFEDFTAALMDELNGMNRARSLYARGHYNADTNVFTAYKIFVYILEPIM